MGEAVASSGAHGHSGSVILILFGIVLMTVGGLQVWRPTLGWRAKKWQYRDPDALRPSGAGLTAIRISSIVIFAVGLVFLILGVTR